MEPTMHNFDTHSFIKDLISGGIDEKHAEKIVNLVYRSKDYDFSKIATKDQLDNVKTELKADITNAKYDIMKWLIPFFLTNILTIVGLVAAIFFK